jgi:hypothetical protein
MAFIERLHILPEARLSSYMLDTTNIDTDHIQFIKQYLDDPDQTPILFYNLSNVVIEREQECLGVYDGLIGSAEYTITTDYKPTRNYTAQFSYTIWIIHTEDIFDIMKNTIKDEIEMYVSMDAEEDRQMYQFYTPYVEDYTYFHTLNINEEECPICCNNTSPTFITFKCEHSICDECKENMLVAHHTLCPICRKNITPSKLTEQEFYDNLDYEEIEENLDFNKYTSYLIHTGFDIYKCCNIEPTGIENPHYELMFNTE